MSHEMDDVSRSENVSTSESVSSRMLVRSRDFLADICQRMRPHLKWVARQQTQRLPNCKDDESDIVQESVAKACERIDQFKGSTSGQWRAWVVQIVRNHAKDVQRRWSQERRSVDHEERGSRVMKWLADRTSETPSQILAAEEHQQLVDSALASLRIDQQNLIRWRVFQYSTYREIADRLRVTEPTARRHCDAAIDAFKAAIARLDN